MGHFYDAVIAPTLNFVALWLSRACLLGALALLLGIVLGWTR